MKHLDVTGVIDAITKEKEFVLVSHVSPDGDNIGSLVGMALGLQQLGKNVLLVNYDETPRKLRFLEDFVTGFKNELPKPSGILVTLDCGDITRTGFDAQFINKFSLVINIDHHVSNTCFGNLNLVDTNAAATGEIVFNILQQLQLKITEQIATALYTAIMTDTGCFRYSNTTPRTLEVASLLLQEGANLDRINTAVYEANTLAATKFLAVALDRIKIVADGKISYLVISNELIEEHQILDEESDSLVNYAKAIEGVEVAFTVKETQNKVVKISFRSRGKVDVNLVASKFGGGGHQRAAGCKIINCQNTDSLITDINLELKKLL